MSKKQKPKFIPPISTAVSFLRSISKSPDSYLISAKRNSILKEFIPDFPTKTELTIKHMESLRLKDKHNSTRSPKYTRDISHLQDTLKESKSEQLLPPLESIHILPTDPDHLKVYLDASECHSRCSSRGHLCNKEKCLEDFIDRSIDIINPKKNISEENSRVNLMLGLPSGKHDIHNLKG